MAWWNWNRSKAVAASALRLPGGLPASTQNQSVFSDSYSLDFSETDLKLVRALYDNAEPRYKLGAGFARPAINVPVGFMGVPIFRTDEEGFAQELLNDMSHTWSGDILRAHRALLRDGEILARARYSNRSPAYAQIFQGEQQSVEIGYNEAGSFDVETLDEDIGAVTGFRVTHIVIVEDKGKKVEKKLFETVYPDRVIIEWENNFKPRQELPNELGFVPAVLMQNENEASELHGKSELEPLEPYMRFYHDVMLHAGSASQLHSTAKLIVRTRDINRFLANNFTDSEISEGRLKFKNKDLLFFESGEPQIGISGSAAFTEGADIVQARAPLGDTTTLLQYIFLNIVDASEVPEWAFGGAIASSKASVTEQSAPLVHKVSRKRTLVENSWAMIGRMAMSMVESPTAVRVEWDDLAQRDTKSEAEALRSMVDALVSLVDADIASKEAAVEHLRPFIPSLLKYIVGEDEAQSERDRIENELDERKTTEASILNSLLDGGTEEDDRQAGLAAIG